MTGPVLAAALSAVLAASAGSGAPPDARAAHGAQLAERCAGCHATGTAGASRNAGAPPFRSLARRNPIALEQVLGRISRFGHYGMRPMSLSDSDAADIAAYIASLDR